MFRRLQNFLRALIFPSLLRSGGRFALTCGRSSPLSFKRVAGLRQCGAVSFTPRMTIPFWCLWEKKNRVEQKLQMGLSLLNHHSPSQSLLIHVVCLFMCFSNLSKCLSCSNAKPVHLAGSMIHYPCPIVPFFLRCNLLWRSVGKCCFSKGQTKMLREAAAVAACHT